MLHWVATLTAVLQKIGQRQMLADAAIVLALWFSSGTCCSLHRCMTRRHSLPQVMYLNEFPPKQTNPKEHEAVRRSAWTLALTQFAATLLDEVEVIDQPQQALSAGV